MHARIDHDRMNEDHALAAALRALPAPPPPAGWPQLATRVRRRRLARRALWTGLPAALATGLAIAFAWPQWPFHADAPATRAAAQVRAPAAGTPASVHAEAPDPLAALQSSSRQWQAWVSRLNRGGAPLDGRALARAVALQDRIGFVDLQLSAARDPAALSELWRQRIALLQQLGLLHLQPYLVAGYAQPRHATPM